MSSRTILSQPHHSSTTHRSPVPRLRSLSTLLCVSAGLRPLVPVSCAASSARILSRLSCLASSRVSPLVSRLLPPASLPVLPACLPATAAAVTACLRRRHSTASSCCRTEWRRWREWEQLIVERIHCSWCAENKVSMVRAFASLIMNRQRLRILSPDPMGSGLIKHKSLRKSQSERSRQCAYASRH